MTMRNQTPAANGGNAGQWFVRIEHQWRRLVIRLRARLGLVGLRLGVFVPLRFDGAGSNAEAQRRGDAERIWHGSGAWPVSTAELMRT